VKSPEKLGYPKLFLKKLFGPCYILGHVVWYPLYSDSVSDYVVMYVKSADKSGTGLYSCYTYKSKKTGDEEEKKKKIEAGSIARVFIRFAAL